MRKSPFTTEALTPLPAPPSAGGIQYEAVTPRALRVAQDIADCLHAQHSVTRLALGLGALPTGPERPPLYMTRTGETARLEDVFYEPTIGETVPELPPYAVRLGIQGTTARQEQPTDDTTHADFIAMYTLRRIGNDSKLLQCSAAEWGGPRTPYARRAKENTLASLFPGQHTGKIASLETINLGFIDRGLNWERLRPFDEHAFGCDILKVMRCALLHAGNQPISITIADGYLAED